MTVYEKFFNEVYAERFDPMPAWSDTIKRIIDAEAAGIKGYVGAIGRAMLACGKAKEVAAQRGCSTSHVYGAYKQFKSRLGTYTIASRMASVLGIECKYTQREELLMKRFGYEF